MLRTIRYAQEFHSFVGLVPFSKTNAGEIPETLKKLLGIYKNSPGVNATLTAYEQSRPGVAYPYSIESKPINFNMTCESDLDEWLNQMMSKGQFGYFGLQITEEERVLVTYYFLMEKLTEN